MGMTVVGQVDCAAPHPDARSTAHAVVVMAAWERRWVRRMARENRGSRTAREAQKRRLFGALFSTHREDNRHEECAAEHHHDDGAGVAVKLRAIAC